MLTSILIVLFIIMAILLNHVNELNDDVVEVNNRLNQADIKFKEMSRDVRNLKKDLEYLEATQRDILYALQNANVQVEPYDAEVVRDMYDGLEEEFH